LKIEDLRKTLLVKFVEVPQKKLIQTVSLAGRNGGSGV
jgi:hypothetical protein